jgi:glucose-6-phosphate isomerase
LPVDEISTLEESLNHLLSSASVDSYFSIQVYLNRNSYGQALGLRNALAVKSERPVTFGWGPRFLHSTGQYHKGGPKQGVFLQITLDSETDIQVPGRDFTFQELITSQAQGDARVLAETGRPVLTINTKDPESTIQDLLRMLK